MLRQYATNRTPGDTALPDDDQPPPRPAPAPQAEKPESRGARINRLFREAIQDLAALKQCPDKETD